MKIIVLIKQVPATTEVKIDPKTNTLVRQGVESQTNPFDIYAIEESIRIKERLNGGEIVVITMGPPQAEAVLREAISVGVDIPVLLTDRKFAGADTWATGYTLAMGIKKIINNDEFIVICGKQAIDGDTAQVGPSVAEMLGIPHIAYVKKINEINNSRIIVERMMEDGSDIIESSIPCLVTVVKDINTPRLPSLKGMMRAKKTEIKKFSAAELNCEEDKIGLAGSPTIVSKIFTPPPKPGGEMLIGAPHEQAEKLVNKLKELKVI